MSEVRETKKTKLIAFRVTDEEYAQIERIALALGEEQNNWCRNIIVTEVDANEAKRRSEILWNYFGLVYSGAFAGLPRRSSVGTSF